ncbi:MAG TPA: hypothetical protein VNS79_12310 [Sphingobium sp.]|nr:hypothetical protein [Sphingobium sp.]
MTKAETPITPQPSSRKLGRATLLAAGAAAIILVTTVLPAEYGVDPTGIGGVLGLTAMGQMKQAAAPGATAGEAPDRTTLPDGSTQLRLTLRPYQGIEAKASMKAGEAISYRWSTDGPAVEFEFHGDPAGGDGTDYSSYEKDKAASGSGDFRAGFDGVHGWYWKNATNKPIVVTASVKGEFETFAVLD